VQIEVLPAHHTVPAVGFAVEGNTGWWVFSGDTERNPAFWKRINTLKVACLVIETAFSNRESDLAQRSLHLSPEALAQELAHIPAANHYPIYITHTKPSETALIIDEIKRFDSTTNILQSQHDIRWLAAGQTVTV
jgi:ribonuclease BN (tRNA processing enzyme)